MSRFDWLVTNLATLPMAKRSKRAVGDYICEKDHKLGEGKSGTVYRGYHIRTHQVVAIKIINIVRIGQEHTKMVMNEISVMKKLSLPDSNGQTHPNILKLLYYEKSQKEKYYLVTSFAQETLSSYIKSHPKFTEKEFTPIIKQLLTGLIFIHSKGVIHRDLKPDNILLSDGIIKIADFGLGKDQRDLLETHCGTPRYMSPEILRFKPYDKKADIWSMGLIIYQLVFGKYPFSTRDPTQWLNDVETKKLDFTICSVELGPLLKKMLQVDSKKRISSMDLAKEKYILDGQEVKIEEVTDFDFINSEDTLDSEPIHKILYISQQNKICFPSEIFDFSKWKNDVILDILEIIELNAKRSWVIAELAHLKSLSGHFMEAIALYVVSIEILFDNIEFSKKQNQGCQRLRAVQSWIRGKANEFMKNVSHLKLKVKTQTGVPENVSPVYCLYVYANILVNTWRIMEDDTEKILYKARAQLIFGYLLTSKGLPKDHFVYLDKMSKFLNKM